MAEEPQEPQDAQAPGEVPAPQAANPPDEPSAGNDAVPAAVPLAEDAENLSQADIDRLMAEANKGDATQAPVFRANGDRFSEKEMPRVESHDFTNPVVIDEILLRALRQRHEEFVAFVSARLSIFLRMDFALKLQRITTTTYRRFTSQVPNPSHVVLFKMEPLPGVGVMDVDLRLGLALVERMLGGRGRAAMNTDSLSEIEMNLLDDVLGVVLEEWCRLWSGDGRLAASVVGHENGGRYLQTSASDAAMLIVSLEAALGECNERIQLAIPYGSVDGALRGMTASRLAEGADKARPARLPGWSQAFNGIPIPLSVEWDACELTLREVVALSSGTVVRLPRDVIARTHVRLGDDTKFIGEVGVEDGRLAIRIDQKLSSEAV